MEVPETNKCCYCYTQDSHPVYGDWCEDCYVEMRLTKMYGRKHKDRSISGSPKTARDIDLESLGDG